MCVNLKKTPQNRSINKHFHRGSTLSKDTLQSRLRPFSPGSDYTNTHKQHTHSHYLSFENKNKNNG